MAKVKFSALISEMRNKLNGSVFSRNRGGAYLRTKVTPTNPQTLAQVQQRSLLTSFSQSWRSLTEAQREAWKAAVTSWAKTDVFGDVVNPSGSTLYIRLNINVSLAGGAALLVPPSPTGAAALTLLTFTASVGGGGVDVTFLPAAVPANHAMVIESTPMLSPGISNAKAKFRVIETLAPAAASPADVTASQTLKFGALVVGQKMFIRAKFINNLTGEVSQQLNNSVIVTA
jgi:hypothetical protein